VRVGGQPCKPAVYRRLVGFLGGVLGEGDVGTPKSTPGGRKRNAEGSVKKGRAVEPQRREPSTLSKTGRENTFLGKIKASVRKTDDEGNDDGRAPKFAMPAIRSLCKTFSTPLLAPHVYTGLCVVLKLDGIWPLDEDDMPEEESLRETVTGLLIALYIMTLTLMKKGLKLKVAEYMSTCARAVEVLKYKPGVQEVSAWIRKIKQNGYAAGQDWFANVPQNVFDFKPAVAGDVGVADEGAVQDAGDMLEDEENEDEAIPSGRKKRKILRRVEDSGDTADDVDDPEGVLLPGLHTMMQNSLELLSEERTREFERWKKQFLQKLDRLEKSPLPNRKEQ
jgi:hypothetical protein